jgi:hypothetical protein
VRTRTDWTWGQSSFLFCGFRRRFLRRRETDRPTPFNVGVTNSWLFTSISLGVLLNTRANLPLPFITIIIFETMGGTEWISLYCNVRSSHSLLANVETAIISLVLLYPSSVDIFFFSKIHYRAHCHLHKNLIKPKILTRQFI